jgi:DTW domain-containing protein YfiP
MEIEVCKTCLKVPDLCVCQTIEPSKTRLHVLILQHPQEPDKDLGSARLAHLTLPNSTIKIGLSWPNLKAALGREAQPARWAVLYLGSGVKGQKPALTAAPALHFVSKAGQIAEAPRTKDLEGLVVLDGTWSQAKALWWRNAWLLKLKRAILASPNPSLYRELRREPRKECYSTIETIAESLTALGEPKEAEENLKGVVKSLLDKKREQLKKKRQSKI